MTRILIILMLLACTVRAELYLYNSKLGQTPPELPAYVMPVDVATTNHGWSLPMIPVQEYPVLYDADAVVWAHSTGEQALDRANLRAARREARQAARDAIAAAREQRQAWRAVAKDWRQTGRDCAKAVGLPAATGAVWGVEAMYAAIATITNDTTRRNLALRALAADLAQTRYQLQQQFPAIEWWWVEDDDNE